MLALLSILLVIFLAAVPARAGDEVFATVVDGVDVKLFVPEEARPVRGVIAHVANYKLKTDDRWAEMSRQLGYAHLALSMDMKRNNRPRIMRGALAVAMKEFAEKHERPELLNVPYMGVGHSAGGMCVPVLLEHPERTITNATSCSWVTDATKLSPEAAAVPAVFIIGSVPDAFKMLPAIEEKYAPARKQGLPWGLALQWEVAHDFANSATLFSPWMIEMAKLRVPADADVKREPPALRPLKQEDGWLGDLNSTDGTFATIAPFAEYQGDKSAATWLPNRSVAYVWRAFVTRNSPVHLSAQTTDGEKKLAAFKPKSEFGLTIMQDDDLNLGATIAGDLAITELEFFNGDQSLGKAMAHPWQVTWKQVPQGCHAIFVHWKAEGGREGVSNPALIVSKKKTRPSDR